MIKILLDKGVVLAIKQQVKLAVESVLYVDAERGDEGGDLVRKFFMELVTQEGFQHLQTIDLNGLFMVVSALFKACNNQRFILDMFQAIHP